MTNTSTLISLILPRDCIIKFIERERTYKITCPDWNTAQWVFNNRESLYTLMKTGEMLRVVSQGFEQITYPLP